MRQQTLNPRALLLSDAEVRISLYRSDDGRDYLWVKAALGLSRWNTVLAVSVSENERD